MEEDNNVLNQIVELTILTSSSESFYGAGRHERIRRIRELSDSLVL